MPIQDLTPDLRTRLSHVERWVGAFVTLATLLLMFGLAYYVFQVAQRKGWFLQKVPYHTYLRDATGLKVGDPVKLMGFDVGEVTEIQPMAPYDYFNIYMQFRVKEPYYGYLWTDSLVRVGSKDLLGSRFVEVTKGSTGAVTVLVENEKITGILDFTIKTNIDHVPLANLNYVPLTNGAKGYWLTMAESPALTERLEQVVNAVENALPNFLNLTNELTRALTNVSAIVTHTDELLVGAKPILANFSIISSNLSGPKGTLGEWLIPTNINTRLEATLSGATGVLSTAETNVALLSSNLTLTLQNVAQLTSNLNAQVQANSFILSEVSSLVVNVDDMVQGLKRHWLLKGSFATTPETNRPPVLLQPRIGTGP